jgi:hypothetical protein
MLWRRENFLVGAVPFDLPVTLLYDWAYLRDEARTGLLLPSCIGCLPYKNISVHICPSPASQPEYRGGGTGVTTILCIHLYNTHTPSLL